MVRENLGLDKFGFDTTKEMIKHWCNTVKLDKENLSEELVKGTSNYLTNNVSADVNWEKLE